MLEGIFDFRSYTLKHYLIILGVVLFASISIIMYTNNKKEEAEKRLAEKESFVLMYTYDEDLVRPVVEEELSIDELVEVIISEQLGGGTKPVSFAKGTIREDLGLFVESGIIEGDTIPQISALSKDAKNGLNSDRSSTYMEKLFAEISKQKQEAIASYRANDVDETTLLLQELKQRLAEQ